jgi:chromosome segregation ATPase
MPRTPKKTDEEIRQAALGLHAEDRLTTRALEKECSGGDRGRITRIVREVKAEAEVAASGREMLLARATGEESPIPEEMAHGLFMVAAQVVRLVDATRKEEGARAYEYELRLKRDHEAVVSALRTELEEMEADRDATAQSLEASEAACSAANQLNAEQAKRLAEQGDSLDRSQRDLEEVRGELRKEREEAAQLRSREKELATQVVGLGTQLSGQQAEAKRLTSEVEGLRGTAAERQEELDRLRSQVAGLEREKAVADAQREAAEAQTAVVREEAARTAQQLETMFRRHAEAEPQDGRGKAAPRKQRTAAPKK